MRISMSINQLLSGMIIQVSCISAQTCTRLSTPSQLEYPTFHQPNWHKKVPWVDRWRTGKPDPSCTGRLDAKIECTGACFDGCCSKHGADINSSFFHPGNFVGGFRSWLATVQRSGESRQGPGIPIFLRGHGKKRGVGRREFLVCHCAVICPLGSWKFWLWKKVAISENAGVWYDFVAHGSKLVTTLVITKSVTTLVTTILNTCWFQVPSKRMVSSRWCWERLGRTPERHVGDAQEFGGCSETLYPMTNL